MLFEELYYPEIWI